MAEAKDFTVYILTNKPRRVLYVGVTSNLPGRGAQHREKVFDGFTKRYNVDRLVWYQAFDEPARCFHI
jgi:putative endonuclease